MQGRTSIRPLQRLIQSFMKSKFGQIVSHIFCVALATTIFALTAAFAKASISVDSTSAPRHILRFSSTLAILRVLQGITSTVTTFVLGQTLELLQWTLSSRESGLRLLSLLSISPTTGILGMLGIIRRRAPKAADRFWALLRFFLMAAIWLSGIVLFINTSVATVYDPILTFNVTAGAGSFNGSFVKPTLQNVGGRISYWILASAYDFIMNPQFSVMASPVSCSGGCDSYIFPGAVWSMNPAVPDDAPANTMVTIYNSPASQMEFRKGLSDRDQFSEQDCTVYGESTGPIGAEFCLARSQAYEGSIIAGIFVCTNGTAGGHCLVSGTSLNISTTLTVYTRQATSTCYRSNNTILSVTDLRQPVLNEIDIDGLYIALNWLLNYTAAGLPAVSSIVYLFWNAPPGLGVHDWSVDAYQSLKSLLAFPIWEFSANNYGDPFEEDLPPEFHTSASVCEPYDRIVINSGMFIAYLVLQSIVLAFFWGVIIWRWIGHYTIPELSSYPLIDFAAKLINKDILSKHSQLLDTEVEKLVPAGNKQIVEILNDLEVTCREDNRRTGTELRGLGDDIGANSEGGNAVDLHRRLTWPTHSSPAFSPARISRLKDTPHNGIAKTMSV